MSEMLYLQTERNIKITSPVVTLGDVAQLSCSDGAVLARNQVRRVAHLPDDGYGRYVCSASTLVRLVTEAEEHVDVTHIGEPNFILTYEDPRQKNTWISWCKTILVGILTFIGTAFSIMTFHTDIGIRELFLDVYTRFFPQMTPGFSVLEISYSIGIGLGVVLYFNHFGRRKFTQDPTPLEVEMQVYEDDIDTTILDPELLTSAPASVAAACGIDAFIHAEEAYISTAASPFSDAMAEKAMELIGKNIRRFVARRTDLEAAEAMLTGSLFAGIAFSYARLGNVHAMSHPVSAFFDVPHGLANAVLLPVIAEYNALADHGRYLKIYNYISEIPAYADEFEPMMLVGAIRELTAAIGIPVSLTDAIRQAAKGKEVTAEEIESKIVPMAVDAMKSGNIAVNPRASRQQDIEALYRKAL